MNEELFLKYEQLFSLYQELYKNGLIGIGKEYIQLNNAEFTTLFMNPEEIKVVRADGQNIELQTIRNNIKYIVLI